MKAIKVPLPVNLDTSLYRIYEDHTVFYWKRPSIKRLKNVFVTNSGLCINQNGLIKECHHDYPDQIMDYLNEASHHYHLALARPESILNLDNEHTYLLIHHIWFNYYHWLCEPIFRLWMVRHKLERLILLLPERYKGVDFIENSILPFGEINFMYIPEGKNLLIRNLCLPEIKQVCDSYHPVELRRIGAFYRKFVLERKSPLGNKLFLNRKKAGRRQVINETEMEKVLILNGFATYSPEDFSFLDQIAIMSQVKYFVSTHGSGLTNIMFMKPGSAVLELHQLYTNRLKHPSFAFWYMAAVVSVRYYHQLCRFAGTDDYFTSDYIVDAELLSQNLKLMVSGRPQTGDESAHDFVMQ